MVGCRTVPVLRRRVGWTRAPHHRPLRRACAVLVARTRCHRLPAAPAQPRCARVLPLRVPTAAATTTFRA